MEVTIHHLDRITVLMRRDFDCHWLSDIFRWLNHVVEKKLSRENLITCSLTVSADRMEDEVFYAGSAVGYREYEVAVIDGDEVKISAPCR